MSVQQWVVVGLIASFAWQPYCHGQTILFEDTFDHRVSDKWQGVGLAQEDYRVRDGGLELRIKEVPAGQPRPLLKVDLPFSTSDTIIASVDVQVVGQSLQRGEEAGLCLTDQDGAVFTTRKTNIDGYFVLAPGEVDFIGKPGQEGDPGKYTIKYWPADALFGPLRIVIRQHNAYFQVGPSAEGKFKTFFHSAIQKSDNGMGFGMTAVGNATKGDRWVRFDNFRVFKP